MPWFSTLLRCLGMRKEPGDLTSFSGEMPPFEAKKKPTTGVNYINGENALTENCVETKRIDDLGGCGSDQNTNDEAMPRPRAWPPTVNPTKVLSSKIPIQRTRTMSPPMGPIKALSPKEISM
ncbi:uncharacterized protein ATNIH1004_011575 [Aspergillus tanneri]|uniref:Uncharacterized protein n=1 Tax=Aspergillus tanneri TaxID=1220188 RepID=A0A5M9MB19_9EURO|nr:uncharacterized protein ATNIH1004_011575 [Aspergillus tanneri]KAA8642630.1 hypothetical protein ATNIH1004_011575 [Aspergillus tanneri]